MTIAQIYEYADKIGLLTFSTIVRDEVHSVELQISYVFGSPKWRKD